MFIDPPYLLNNIYDSTHTSDCILNFIQDFNNYNCKIIAVLGNHILLKYFYKNFDLNVKFLTIIKFICVKFANINFYSSFKILKIQK